MKKIFTPFVLWYIRLFAKLQLKKTHPLIVGVAGSSGKSSLSMLISLVLKTTYKVDSSKEKNSETGIPLHILNIHMEKFSYVAWLKAIFLAPLRLLFYWPKVGYFVAEMGIDSPVEPKNMSYLLKIIRPMIGVVTNVSLEHSVYFEPYVKAVTEEEKMKKVLDLTAEQETMLLRSLPASGYAVVNLDDHEIRKVAGKVKAEKITISLKEFADLVGKDITSNLEQFHMNIVHQGKVYPLTIKQPLPNHFAYEFLMAIGVGLAAGVSLSTAMKALEENFSLPAGRLSFFKGIEDTIIIDSSYNNATLPPILDILDFMKTISGKRRKVVILGDMRELGEASEANHREVAQKILTTADYAILIGPMMQEFAAPVLMKAKFPYESYATFTEAKDHTFETIKEKDVILVKGSQNTLYLERVVEMLLADKKDVAYLTRRGEFWDKKRASSL